MEVFNERIVFYGDLILTDETIKDLRCDLIVNHLNTDYNIAEISIPSSVRSQIHNRLHLQSKFIFQTEKKSKSIYLESYRYELQDKFLWEASLTLYAHKVNITDSYSDKTIDKTVFRAFISPSELLFNETQLTFHGKKGLLSGWNYSPISKESEWIDNIHEYQSEIGPIVLVPGFIFKELKDDKFCQRYNILRQLIVYCEVKSNVDLEISEGIFLEELDKLIKTLSLLFVKRINSWYNEVSASDSDNYPVFDKRTFLRLSKRTPLKDNRFIYGDAYKKLHSTISIIMGRLSKLNNDKIVLFERLLDRYLIAFTYDKIDTQIIYALSCLDIIKNKFPRTSKRKRGFIKNLIDVCDQNNIEWLDLFPYLTKDYINGSKDNDMILNKARVDIIHYGVYPNEYSELSREILSARALCERFILQLLDIDYKITCLGSLTRY